MFSKNLSLVLLRFCDENEISQEVLAEKCQLSPRYLGRLICRHSVPTLTVLEKISQATSFSPNELLLPFPDNAGRDELPVTEGRQMRQFDGSLTAFCLCPQCGASLEREYQAFCDSCGQKLNWDRYPEQINFR